jgi:hypothetical protein
MQEVTEGTGNEVGLITLELFDAILENPTVLRATLAPKAHGRSAQGFDDVESGFAFGFADDITEHTAQQADFFAISRHHEVDIQSQVKVVLAKIIAGQRSNLAIKIKNKHLFQERH